MPEQNSIQVDTGKEGTPGKEGVPKPESTIDPQNLSDHEKSMIAKAEGTKVPEEGNPGEPKGEPEKPKEGVDEQFTMPEKFKGKTAEEIAKSYLELEKMKGKEETPLKIEEKGEEEPQDNATKGIPQDRLDHFTKEYKDNNGTLSDESFKELSEKYGRPREEVENYFRGQEAITELTIMKIFEMAGSEAKFRELTTWGKDNLSDSEIQFFNDSLDKGLPEIQIAMDFLKGKHQLAGGPNFVEGTTGGGGNMSGEQPYNSWAELTKDQGSPQYAKDPAFRAKVERRIAKSTALG